MLAGSIFTVLTKSQGTCSTSISPIKRLSRVEAASPELCGFQAATLGGPVKSPAVSQEEDIAVIQHVNSEAMLVSFLQSVKRTTGKILNY